ncbi:kinase-like domain-containing protein [Xylaria nigripes]|nr:kinase-like domain-containing protein [Xylaria nigripes]
MSECPPIAQIFCRYIEKPLRGRLRSGKGFIDCRVQQGKHSALPYHASLDISLYPDQLVRVGREVERNDIAILHPYISRSHFVIYSVEYEEGMQPLIYVRDYSSLSGTYVDNKSTRPMKLSSSSGHILSQGEIIRLEPYWEFHVYLLSGQPVNSIVGQLPSNETDLFRDRFLITERILGKGGFASVHLAVNVRTGRQVACKIHQLDRFRQSQRSSSTIRRILDETNILSRLTHPHLLKFEAAFRSSTTLYTFTELATGGDLFSMRLTCPDAVLEIDTKIIVRQVIEAAAYLHEQGVTHRDLKPENIFFATGPAPLARIIVGDFGFAKVNKSSRMASKIGTQRFMAPEVYRGQSYGTEVDIWSIGMISLFLVMTDWNSLGRFETFEQNKVDEGLIDIFSDPSYTYENLSTDFRDFVRLCLVVEPSRRMTAAVSKGHNWFRSSASQLKAQIEAFVQGWEPVRVVHNSIEDLALVDGSDTKHLTPMASSEKWKTPDYKLKTENSGISQYFAQGESTRCSQQWPAPGAPALDFKVGDVMNDD